MDLSGKDYFSQAEAAHYCCLSLRKFQLVEADLGIPRIPFKGKILYRRSDLQRVIEWQVLEKSVDGQSQADRSACILKVTGCRMRVSLGDGDR